MVKSWSECLQEMYLPLFSAHSISSSFVRFDEQRFHKRTLLLLDECIIRLFGGQLHQLFELLYSSLVIVYLQSNKLDCVFSIDLLKTSKGTQFVIWGKLDTLQKILSKNITLIKGKKGRRECFCLKWKGIFE